MMPLSLFCKYPVSFFSLHDLDVLMANNFFPSYISQRLLDLICFQAFNYVNFTAVIIWISLCELHIILPNYTDYVPHIEVPNDFSNSYRQKTSTFEKRFFGAFINKNLPFHRGPVGYPTSY